MAFFGSKSYERALKRTYSTDRLRRERGRVEPHASTTHSHSQSHAHTHSQTPHTQPNPPLADEFGVISAKEGPSLPLFSSTSTSESLPAEPISRLGSTSLFVPTSSSAAGPSSSSSSLNKQPSVRTRTLSGSGSGSASKHSAHSSNPPRRRMPQLDVDAAPSSDVARSRTNSGASGSKMSEPLVHMHSSSDLKVEHGTLKSRSKTSLRAQAVSESAQSQACSSSSVLARPPRSSRPYDSQTNSSRPSPFPSSSDATSTSNQIHSPASHSISSPSSSPLSLPSKTGAPLRQRSSPSVASGPASVSRRDDSSLALLPYSNPDSVSKKSSCGNASDGSYGSPFSEFGIGFSVKRLLSKPAASPGPGGVRSEPDTSAEYAAYGLAARRRRLELGHVPDTPSAYSVTGAITSPRDHARKPTTSDPEPPRSALGSFGRTRRLDWGHVLGREREREGGKAHTREGSSYSVSSPSEGAAYPYGLALERKASKSTRPLIQLTTSAVRRLSALGAREVERERDLSPVTPMLSATPSPADAFAPSPLTTVGVRSKPACAPQSAASASPSPSSLGAGTASRTDSPSPVGLTPAEIVAHAYKEQERRRAELERDAEMHAGVNPKEHEKAQRTVRVKEKERGKVLSRRTSTNAAISNTNSNHKGNASPSGETHAPYYTVFGEPTGRVVAIGSPRDSAWGLFDRGHERRAKAMEQAVVAEISLNATAPPSSMHGTDSAGSASAIPGVSDVVVAGAEEKTGAPLRLRRKLSRKMSGKFKRDGSSPRGARESGKDSSDGRDGKGDFAELLSGGEDGYGTEGHVRSRPSLTLNTSSSGRRSATLPREKNAQLHPLKISLDSFVAVQRTEPGSGKMLPSAANGMVPSPRPFISGAWGREERTGDTGGKSRAKHEKDERDREKEKEKEKDKGKLWGLVKRISSNTLKDKYKRASTELVPPVPALPRDISSASASPTFDIEKEKAKLRTRESESVMRRNRGVDGDKDARPNATSSRLGMRPSLSHLRRPSTAPAQSAMDPGKEGRFATLRKKPSAEQVQAQSLATSPTRDIRPSVTTGSSSPISSDIAFSFKHSDGSSTTSSGDLISTNGRVASKPVLGQHILPPETLYLFDDFNLSFDERKEDDAKSKPDSRDTRSAVTNGYESLFYGEEPTNHQALPVPPRRTTQTKPDDYRSESPTIPSFSAENAINTFGFRNRSGTNTGASVASAFTGVDFGPRKVSTSLSPAPSLKSAFEPPPRPPRSSRRGPAAPSVLQSSHSSHSSHSSSPSLVRTNFEDRGGRASIGAHSQASTARPGVLRASPCSSPSPPPELLDSQSPVSASDSASSTMTFRDMNGMAAKPMWTEKEKIDKWNDLLDRSEKAGGTLHVGVGGLLSDHIRESAYEPMRNSPYSDF